MKRQRMKLFTAAVSRCLENHKYENVMSLFARIRQTRHQKVCRTCGTIICPHSTNYVIELWRCVCRCRRHLFKLPFVAGQLAFIKTFIMILFAFCFHPPSSKQTRFSNSFNRIFLSNTTSSLSTTVNNRSWGSFLESPETFRST